MVPTLACNQPCKTCASNDKSSCTSCYETGSFQFLQSSTCVAACSTGWINKGTFTCTQCDSVCATCDNNDETSCLTCDKTGSTPYFDSNRCLTECPSTKYSNSFICTDCVSPCSSCNSPSECTSCLNDGSNTLIYLQGTQCISACPDGSTSVSFTCTTCTDPCLECQTSASSCTKCTGSKKLYTS